MDCAHTSGPGGNETDMRGIEQAEPRHNKQKQMNTLEENKAATADRE